MREIENYKKFEKMGGVILVVLLVLVVYLVINSSPKGTLTQTELTSKVNQLFSESKYQQAIGLITSQSSSVQNSELSQTELANAYSSIGNYKEALNIYSGVIKNFGVNGSNAIGAAQDALKAGEKKTAAYYYNQAANAVLKDKSNPLSLVYANGYKEEAKQLEAN